jgi:hypothetical protein
MRPSFARHHAPNHLDGDQRETLEAKVGCAAEPVGRLDLLHYHEILDTDAEVPVLVVARLVAADHPRRERRRDVIPRGYALRALQM